VAHFGPIRNDESYESEKRAWVEAHPEATPEQYQQAIKQIAERLNY